MNEWGNILSDDVQ